MKKDISVEKPVLTAQVVKKNISVDIPGLALFRFLIKTSSQTHIIPSSALLRY